MRPTGPKGPLVIGEIRDMFRLWDVFTSLVMRDFKGRYRAKILGVFWSVGDPLVMMFVYTLVFTYFFRRQVYAYPVVLLLGLCPHRYFANGVTAVTNSMVDYSPLVKRVAFPRHLLPLAVLGSHLIHFLIELLLILVVAQFYPSSLRLSTALLWLPLVLTVQISYMMGLSFLCATLNVWFRDTQYMLKSALLVLYWLTPIFYPASFIPDRFRPFFYFNPMAGVVTGYRRICMHGLPPDFSFLAVGGALSLLLLVAGTLTFRRWQGDFADYV